MSNRQLMESVRCRYVADVPSYEKVVAFVVGVVSKTLRSQGISCTISSRVKSVASVVKKCAAGKAYEDIVDFAGIRVVLTYPDRQAEAIQTIRERFATCLDREHTATNPKVFDYRGFHLRIALSESELSPDLAFLAGLTAEIQILKPGEALWLNFNHDIGYKSVEADFAISRQLGKLSAVLEIVDDVTVELFKATRALPVDEVVHELTEQHARFATRQGDYSMTKLVVEGAMSALAGKGSLSVEIAEFVQAQNARIAAIYARYLDESSMRGILLSQPESLLILLAAEGCLLPELEACWVEATWPWELATQVVDLWGDPG